MPTSESHDTTATAARAAGTTGGNRAPDGTDPAGEWARDWAESGIMALTGHRGGPPLLPPGGAATLARTFSTRIAAAGALGGHTVRLDGAQLLSERAAFTGRRRNGRVSAGGACRLLPTADGWAAVSCARPDDPSLLGAMIGRDVGPDPWPEVAEWLLRHPGRDLAARAELLGVAAGPVVHRHPPGPGPSVPDQGFSGRALSTLNLRPVTDLLVVDFSSLWAGPLCAHILGLAGARIVKVETPQRPDGARRGNPGFYRLLHAGHASVVLDPATAHGRRAMARLVEKADIVIEASRPRALAGFGLDAEAAATAGCTWISITAHGRSSNRVGFGDDIAAGSGLVAVDRPGLPVFVGDALADPLTGLAAAALAMSVPASGVGQLWDIAMSAVVAATLSPDPPNALPSPEAGLRAGRWHLEAGSAAYPLRDPGRRSPGGEASASGADTAAVLRQLGIAAG